MTGSQGEWQAPDEDAAFQESLKEPTNTADATALQLVRDQHNSDAAVLKELLLCDDSTDMLEWEQRLQLLGTDEISASLQKPLPTIGYSGLLLPNPHKPETTKWQPLPDKVDLPVRDAPQE